MALKQLGIILLVIVSSKLAACLHTWRHSIAGENVPFHPSTAQLVYIITIADYLDRKWNASVKWRKRQK